MYAYFFSYIYTVLRWADDLCSMCMGQRLRRHAHSTTCSKLPGTCSAGRAPPALRISTSAPSSTAFLECFACLRTTSRINMTTHTSIPQGHPWLPPQGLPRLVDDPKLQAAPVGWNGHIRSRNPSMHLKPQQANAAFVVASPSSSKGISQARLYTISSLIKRLPLQ